MKTMNVPAAVLLLLIAAIAIAGCPKPEDLITPAPPPAGDGNKVATDANGGKPADPWKPPEGEEEEVSFERLVEQCVEKGGVSADNCLMSLGTQKKNYVVCERVATFPKDKCYYEIAIAMPEYHACYEIYDVGKKNLCFKIAGVAMGKESACTAISDTAVKDDCYDSIAYDKQDPMTCNKISDIGKADSCVYDVAKLKGDSGICAYVSGAISKGEYARDNCYLGVAPGSVSTCGRLIDEARKQACYINLAKCEDIISDENRVNCYDTAARNSSSYELCLNIPLGKYKEKREACIEETATANPSKEACGMIAKEEPRYACYKEVGVSLNSLEICNLIQNRRAVRDDCVLEIAKATDNAELCKEIIANDFSKRDYCYSTIAVSLLNLDVCEGITAASKYVKCYSDIAMGKEESDLCATIKKEFWTLAHSSKSECYYNYAIGKLDITVCGKIGDANFSGQCRNELG
ncbi:MAG: hypothetical protein V1676_07340 [Candidatus Diapherotrites archaeon]